MSELKLVGGVLIIGSLIWDEAEIRENWRTNCLDVEKAKAVTLPIRYGRISSERRFTYSMVFSQACKKLENRGMGLVVPFLHPVNIEEFDVQAHELIKAEHKKEPGFTRFNWDWGTLALAVNPRHLNDESDKRDVIKQLQNHWFEKIGKGFNPNDYKVGTEMPIVDKTAHLQIDWVPDLDDYDFVIATATKPNVNKIPDAKEIADRMILNDFDEYFRRNHDVGIVTYQDDEISDCLQHGGMDFINLIARSSIHIIMVRPPGIEPEGFGSGCVVVYKGRKFLLSVEHVTNIDGLATCIETNLPSKDLQTPIYSVGSMCYFDQYKLPKEIKTQEIKSFEELKTFYDDTLDVTFCELKDDVLLLQPEWEFGSFIIYKGFKVFLNLDEAGSPDSDKEFGFCGRIRQNLNGVYLKIQPTLKLGLRYKGTTGRFHYFTVPEIIKDVDDYSGCSGAPILDEDGKLVALTASVAKNTKLVFGFSIEECRKLLDLAIQTNLV